MHWFIMSTFIFAILPYQKDLEDLCWPLDITHEVVNKPSVYCMKGAAALEA